MGRCEPPLLVSCAHTQAFDFDRQVQRQHLIYASSLTGDDDPTRKPTLAEIGGVLDSLIASRAMLVEGGVAAQRKPAVERKVVLNLEPTEVERVLSEVGGQLWGRALGVS